MQQKLKEKRVAYKKWQGTREEGIGSIIEKRRGKQGERGGSCKENCMGAVEW